MLIFGTFVTEQSGVMPMHFNLLCTEGFANAFHHSKRSRLSKIVWIPINLLRSAVCQITNFCVSILHWVKGSVLLATCA